MGTSTTNNFHVFEFVKYFVYALWIGLVGKKCSVPCVQCQKKVKWITAHKMWFGSVFGESCVAFFLFFSLKMIHLDVSCEQTVNKFSFQSIHTLITVACLVDMETGNIQIECILKCIRRTWAQVPKVYIMRCRWFSFFAEPYFCARSCLNGVICFDSWKKWNKQKIS